MTELANRKERIIRRAFLSRDHRIYTILSRLAEEAHLIKDTPTHASR